MAALYQFVQHVRTNIPSRTASFAGHHGPIAWLGVNSLGRPADEAACASIKRSFLTASRNGGCDFYFDVAWHKEGSPAIECPPDTTAKLSVLDCGSLNNDVAVTLPADADADAASAAAPLSPEGKAAKLFERGCARDSDYYKAVTATVSSLTEKGYIPLCVGDSPNITVAALDGIRQVTGNDNIVVVHFSADTRMGTADGAMKRILERKLAKGVTQFGQRTVTSAARAIRKTYEVRHADAHALYDRGIFTLKDIRQGYPVYLSVDLDVLEPCFAPGVAQPEAGGFATRELVHLLSVLRAPSIVGMDIVGYAPENDVYRRCGGDGVTSIAAAKVLKEMVLKAMTASSTTRLELSEYIQQQKVQGNHPGQYPEH